MTGPLDFFIELPAALQGLLRGCCALVTSADWKCCFLPKLVNGVGREIRKGKERAGKERKRENR